MQGVFGPSFTYKQVQTFTSAQSKYAPLQLAIHQKENMADSMVMFGF